MSITSVTAATTVPSPMPTLVITRSPARVATRSGPVNHRAIMACREEPPAALSPTAKQAITTNESVSSAST